MSSLKRYPLPVVWTLACFAFVMVIIINGIIAYQALTELTDNQRDVANTLSRIIGTKSAFAALLDAETGQRGYLLTGETKYFEPYEAGLRAVDDHMQELKAAIGGAPVQRELVEQLDQAIAAKVEELQQVMTQMRQGQSPQIPMGLMSSQGKRRLDLVRELVTQLEH